MKVPQLGSPSGYDGENPSWTLVFVGDSPTEGRRKAVEAAFETKEMPGSAGLFFEWRTDRVEVALGDCWWESSKDWKRTREAVAAGCEEVHALEPLAAIVFLDTDEMSEAPKALLARYAALKGARGKRRRTLALEALESGEPKLEALALSFVESIADDGALETFASRSGEHQQRVTAALSEALRSRFFDYDKRPEAYEKLLSSAPPSLLDARGLSTVPNAAVRDLPRMGLFLASLADEHPDLWNAVRSDLEARSGDGVDLTLAFALAELGQRDEARALLEAAREALKTKEAKTPLWKKTIPGWLDDLQGRL